MKNVKLQKPTKSDLEEMREIWHDTFGSKDADLFFEFFFNPKLSLVSKYEDKTVAMGHLLSVGDLIISEDNSIPTAIIYAVATLPEYRNFGLGGMISKNLISLARDAGYPAVALWPAQDSLFNFYSLKTDMKEWFYSCEYKQTAPFATKGHTELSEISSEEYLHLREKLLCGIPHIRLNQRTLEYQKRLCALYGGGLFQVKTSNGISCAVVERQDDDSICIKELIMPSSMKSPDELIDNLQNIAADAVSLFPAVECVVRTPATNKQAHIPMTNIHFSSIRRAMLSLPPEQQNTPKSMTFQPWYGLALD